MIKIKKMTNFNGFDNVVMPKKDFIKLVELLNYSKYEHLIDFEEVENE